MHAKLMALLIAAAALWPLVARAVVVVTQPAAPLASGFNPGGGCCDGSGVWFNPLTGYAEVRSFLFPDPLLEDGKYLLLSDTSFGNAQAQLFVEGLFGRGNGVVYASTSNKNPARFDAGASIGAATGYQNPGAGFPDLGPLFGNWTPGRGFLGLTIRDPAGSTAADIFYGWADVTVNADYSITLNAFAYENVRGLAITTAFVTAVPEPAAGLMFAAGLAALWGVARTGALRRARR